MKDLETNKDLLLDIVAEIKELADDVLADDLGGDFTNGQLLAYASALSIIRDALSGYELEEYGLDFDIDKKYLLK